MAFLSLILVSKYISDVSMQPTRFKLLPFCCIGNTGQSLSFGMYHRAHLFKAARARHAVVANTSAHDPVRKDLTEFSVPFIEAPGCQSAQSRVNITKCVQRNNAYFNSVEPSIRRNLKTRRNTKMLQMTKPSHGQTR